MSTRLHLSVHFHLGEFVQHARRVLNSIVCQDYSIEIGLTPEDIFRIKSALRVADTVLYIHPQGLSKATVLDTVLKYVRVSQMRK